MALDLGDDDDEGTGINLQRDVRETDFQSIVEGAIVFNSTAGHDHSGTAGEGKQVVALGTQIQNANFNSHKLTSLANGTADTDSAAFGQIGIVSGTKYYSISGADFKDDATYGNFDATAATNQGVEAASDFIGTVHLPDGAVITGAIVYVTGTGDAWKLYRSTLNGATQVEMASGVSNTEDTSITSGTVDNSQYHYFFKHTSNSEEILSARIKYTL